MNLIRIALILSGSSSNKPFGALKILQMETMYSIDGQEPCTLKEIIESNDDLHPEYIDRIRSLKIGESTFVEIDEVKRVS